MKDESCFYGLKNCLCGIIIYQDNRKSFWCKFCNMLNFRFLLSIKVELIENRKSGRVDR